VNLPASCHYPRAPHNHSQSCSADSRPYAALLEVLLIDTIRQKRFLFNVAYDTAMSEGAASFQVGGFC
jgi:hypothetical protein